MKNLILSMLVVIFCNGCMAGGPGPGSCVDHCPECKSSDCIERLDCLCGCDPACKSNSESTDISDTDFETE